MATPHVVAAAALYRAKNPGATADQVEAALKKCAKRLPEMKSKTFTEALGYGLVHLPKLL
jgi:subtilisin family serine protease